jgi:hypothetical protein
MKNLKIVIIILLIATISNNVFSQDTCVKIYGFNHGPFSEKKQAYVLKTKYKQDANLCIDKNKISIGDMFNTELEILYIKDYYEDCQIKKFYFCNDNEGRKCCFKLDKDAVTNEVYYVIYYSDYAYFYYTKK